MKIRFLFLPFSIWWSGKWRTKWPSIIIFTLYRVLKCRNWSPIASSLSYPPAHPRKPDIGNIGNRTTDKINGLLPITVEIDSDLAEQGTRAYEEITVNRPIFPISKPFRSHPIDTEWTEMPENPFFSRLQLGIELGKYCTVWHISCDVRDLFRLFIMSGMKYLVRFQCWNSELAS